MGEEVHLVDRARQGDRRAWRALFEAHASAVRRVCLGFSSFTGADVEDAVQDTFVRALRSLDALRDADKFRPWSLRIARTVCLEKLSKKKSVRRVETAFYDDPTLGPSAADRLDEAFTRERRIGVVRALIDGLPDGAEKDTVRLFYVDGSLSAREIAEKLGTNKSTITMRLERFRAKVKRRLVARIVAVEGSA